MEISKSTALIATALIAAVFVQVGDVIVGLAGLAN